MQMQRERCLEILSRENANKLFEMNAKIEIKEDEKKDFFHPDFEIIAGPCAIESEEQIVNIAMEVKEAGATILQGGAYISRTSPYLFQGLKEEGIKSLIKAKQVTGLPIVTEIVSIDTLDLFDEVDIIQVGAHNMQNYNLLKELGKLKKTILLKRGIANTIDELLLSSEYIAKEGNSKIILCERGIRTFEKYTKNTFDISAIPELKSRTRLPVIADPSQASGQRKLVEPLSLAATVIGVDGIMIEVHNEPEKDLCDGQQSLNINQFRELVNKIHQYRKK